MEKIELKQCNEPCSDVCACNLQDFSQSREQAVILEYFADRKGTFLDIGANDGKTFSNTHALVLLGWSGDCIEPTDRAFASLKELYKDNPNIKCHQFAVGNKSGIVDFWEPDDTLVATTIRSETHKWEQGLGFKYKKKKVKMLTVSELLTITGREAYDFVNIDTEGVDFDILKQLYLGNIQMVCIEVNQEHRGKYVEYFARNGMKLLKDTDINLIFAK